MFLNRECPNCRNKIPVWQVKSKFTCKECETKLSSNTGKVQLIGLVIYFVTLPFIWGLAEYIVKLYGSSEAEYFDWRITAGILSLIVVGIYYVISLRIHKIE